MQHLQNYNSSNAIEVILDPNLFQHCMSFESGRVKFVVDFQLSEKCKNEKELFLAAMEKENWKVMDWLSKNEPDTLELPIINYRGDTFPNVAYSRLGALQWLHTHMNSSFPHWQAYMDVAASSGNLELVKFLHENRTEGCTVNAMNGAARNGHLDIVEWLHLNRNEGCTTNAMDGAAANGHINVLEWLHANRSEGYTDQILSVAARNGHMETVEWIHQN